MTKTVLITGASSGFGRDTAETLAAAGHRVFAGVRDGAGRNAGVAAELRARGAAPVELDVADDASVEAAVASVLAATGGTLDVLVNNAGIASGGLSEAFTAEQFKALLNTNVVGVHRLLRAALPALRRGGDGLVVNIGSIVGRVTFPFFGLYGASKFALEALTDSYRYELSQSGVDVVLVQPSAYPTGIYGAVRSPADEARAAEYGEVAALPGKMVESFAQMFAAETAPDPHDVATAVLALVEAARGARPERVVVGAPFGADAVNAAVAPVQLQAVEALGLGALARRAA